MTDDPKSDPPLDEEMDAALRDAYAFAPAAAEEAAARFRVPARRARWPWVALPAAVAAGVAAGVLFAGRSEPQRPPITVQPPPAPTVVGFLTTTTGEVRTSAGKPLRRGDPIYETDGGVATAAGSRATLVLFDGSEVRIDRGSRVVPHKVFAVSYRTLPGEPVPGRWIEVKEGRVWARVTPGEAFDFDAGDLRVVVTGTELSVERSAGGATAQLFSGSARVNQVLSLAAGQEVDCLSGKLSEPRRIVSEAVATGWMLDLYAHAGGRDRELAEHMDRLLVDLGRTKALMVREKDLVDELGASCRVPLARYLVSESAQADLEPRRKAARVLAVIADLSVASDLARAIRDPDPEVRVSTARAIRRLTEGRMCVEPDTFAAASVAEAAAPAIEAWAKEAAPR